MFWKKKLEKETCEEYKKSYEFYKNRYNNKKDKYNVLKAEVNSLQEQNKYLSSQLDYFIEKEQNVVLLNKITTTIQEDCWKELAEIIPDWLGKRSEKTKEKWKNHFMNSRTTNSTFIVQEILRLETE